MNRMFVNSIEVAVIPVILAAIKPYLPKDLQEKIVPYTMDQSYRIALSMAVGYLGINFVRKQLMK